MKVFVAGATGAVGQQLIPLLIADGHHVTGTTRTPAKLEKLAASGATPVLMDALDKDVVMRAIRSAQPDAVIHQMTALSMFTNPKKWDQVFAETNRLRTEGTEYLLRAAMDVGARLFIAQSFTGGPNSDGVIVPGTMSKTRAAIRTLEKMVTSAEGITGIVLRYGSLYGPGTSLAADGSVTELIRKRQMPVVGSGSGVWSFLHVEDAARAAALAVNKGTAGIFDICDDEPAKVAEWLPEFARVIGAPPPRRIPVWLGRMLIGDAGIYMMTQSLGSSNETARRVLGWRPLYASWREGFHEAAAATRAA